jgi:hypothetical protein
MVEARLFSDRTARADVQSSRSEPASLDALLAETEHLLAAFRSLSPDELHMAATKLRILANVSEAWAQRKTTG